MTRTSLKTQLRELLLSGDLEGVAEVAVARRRVLGQLVSLTFDSDQLVVHRAIDATGRCAERLAPVDAESLLELLRRLNWMITEESGGICWHAPEMMAEIVRSDPDRFSDFLDVTASFLITMEPEDLEHFRTSVLRALGLLGFVPEERLAEMLPLIEASLDSPDPQVRGMAGWALSALGQKAILAERSELLSDHEMVAYYADGDLNRITVAELTGSLLKRNR